MQKPLSPFYLVRTLVFSSILILLIVAVNRLVPPPSVLAISEERSTGLLVDDAAIDVKSVFRQQPVPTFSKTFTPNTIGVGSISTLTFFIGNENSPDPATNLAFTDNLPAGVVIATPSNAASTCGVNGVLTAPEGGTTISFSGGRISPYSVCAITVDVTSSALGTHTNVSGDLTSDAGNSGPATADLTVSAGLPGFNKQFNPATISLGNTSTLEFTIDNTASESTVSSLFFTDNLPAGMIVADPSNASTDCGGQLTAAPGTSFISLGNGSVGAFASCTVTVDVTTTAAGLFKNTTGELTSNLRSFGKAGAELEVIFDFLKKSFIDDPVPPGDTTTLQFTITNLDRVNNATTITFTDDLDAVLPGLTAAGLPLANPCGSGSQLSGTGLLSFTGGNLAPESACTFSVTLHVPDATTPGTYHNTTSAVGVVIGGVGTTKNPAMDDLVVHPIPALTKSFIGDPVIPGGTVTLAFTITNTSLISNITNLAFTDDLYAALSGLAAIGLPANNVCGSGSQLSGAGLLTFTGGNLGAGASCTFNVLLQVPMGIQPGTYLNTTGPIAGTIGGEALIGKPATDGLVVIAPPALSKRFVDDPVQPGGTVTLEFTLSHNENAPAEANEITFSDDLNAVLAGLTATGLPINNVCGADSQLSGTSTLNFSGGTLAPGESCTFDVPLQVPAGAAPGDYLNTTSNITATVLGQTVTGNSANDLLQVVSLNLVKSFVDDPAYPGGTVTLAFTATNLSSILTATNIAFTDNLNAALSGLTAIGLPANDICGAGSQLSGTGVLSFGGGSLAPNTTCSFAVTLQVPITATVGEYTNQTSVVTATVDGSAVTANPASDILTIFSPLSIAKTFVDDPVAPGNNVTLEFRLANASSTLSVIGIAFTDDLDAALSGLSVIGLPANDVCGAGSQLSGTGLLTFTGGSLAPNTTCIFTVTLQVPASATPGFHTNTTSSATGTIGSTATTGNPATDDLQIIAAVFTKSFSGNTIPNSSTVLSFTIQNLDPNLGVSGLTFIDDLTAVLPGLVATGLPANDVCGPGSVFTGTTSLALVNGSLGAGVSCTFAVTLHIPLGITPANYLNTTSDLRANGITIGQPATAILAVEQGSLIYLPIVILEEGIPPIYLPIVTKDFMHAFDLVSVSDFGGVSSRLWPAVELSQWLIQRLKLVK